MDNVFLPELITLISMYLGDDCIVFTRLNRDIRQNALSAKFPPIVVCGEPQQRHPALVPLFGGKYSWLSVIREPTIFHWARKQYYDRYTAYALYYDYIRVYWRDVRNNRCRATCHENNLPALDTPVTLVDQTRNEHYKCTAQEYWYIRSYLSCIEPSETKPTMMTRRVYLQRYRTGFTVIRFDEDDFARTLCGFYLLCAKGFARFPSYIPIESIFEEDTDLRYAIDSREISRMRKIIASVYKSDHSLWRIPGAYHLSFSEAFKIRAFQQKIEKMIATL